MEVDIAPCSASTVVCQDPHVWLPSSFEGLVAELKHLNESAEGTRYRGQGRAEYPLDSTLARSIQVALLGQPYLSADLEARERFDSIRGSVEMMWLAQGILQLKFGGLVGIRPELAEWVESNPGSDPYFELMRRLQQYPEQDSFVRGTPLMDWTYAPQVGLYFAATRGDGSVDSETDGALWVCDATAMGKIEHRDPEATLSVEKALDQLREKVRAYAPGGEALPGLPMIFNPRSQRLDLKAERQKAVYFMQVDLRNDLSFIWRAHEERTRKRLYIKLLVPRKIKATCLEWLANNGFTREYLFP